MKILIAEDDVTSRALLSAILKKSGYLPVVVEDGMKAWETMQEADAPKLAILDWVMPGLDGPEVCRRIRSTLTESPPYLIILTAKGEKGDIVKGLDAGANDFISKPFDKEELQARIRVGQRMVELQTELLETKEALAHKAMHDPLTGVLNRRALFDALHKELKRAQRHQAPLSIGLLDIDHFKQINDSYGHQVGDAVLCALVQEIQKKLREHDLLGRYGGEEFMVVASSSRGTTEENLYERLRTAIAALQVPTAAGEIGITASFGVANAEQGTTVDEIVAAADAALYRAKDAGRNCVVYAGE